ncbi:MAG: hypothetical protein HYS25_10410 [Ignavibacteriales bacterium]|nr:hypothetical protein [Ignavibacteriales bacterium]
MNEKNFDRKKFLEIIGLGALIGFIVSALPVKFFRSKQISGKKVKVNLHPSAVKRTNKV